MQRPSKANAEFAVYMLFVVAVLVYVACTRSVVDAALLAVTVAAAMAIVHFIGWLARKIGR